MLCLMICCNKFFPQLLEITCAFKHQLTLSPMTSLRNQYLVRRTVLEMLTDRGYSIDDYQLGSYEEFAEQFQGCIKDASCLRIVVSKNKNTLFVHFSDEEKMSLKSVKMLVENLEKQDIKDLVLVLREGISPAASKFIAECKLHITMFKEKELLFNVTKHKLVYKHRIITNDEKEKLLRDKRIKEEQMPQILVSDPVAKYLGAKKGDVLEITRESETAITSLYWRRAI